MIVLISEALLQRSTATDGRILRDRFLRTVPCARFAAQCLYNLHRVTLRTRIPPAYEAWS